MGKMINTFYWACNNNKSVLVKALLSVIDPSDSDNFAIRYASSNGHIEIVRLLLADNRVDPSAWDNFALRHANYYGHTEIVELLKGAGCD